jgi:hypothetical protein
VLTINHAIQAVINAHTLDWATTQRNNCHGYLLSETGGPSSGWPRKAWRRSTN